MEPTLDANDPIQREQLRRLFRVKRTETEMMAERGYRLDTAHVMRSDRTFVAIDLSTLSNSAIS